MSGLDPQQRAQRERGLCERVEDVCPERASLIVSPKASPIDSRRLCGPHGEPFRADPAYHVGRIEGPALSERSARNPLAYALSAAIREIAERIRRD